MSDTLCHMTTRRPDTAFEPTTPAGEPSRRGRRLSPGRSDDILDAVWDLLGEIGYDQLRVADVADRAGVGLATIYRRWPTKQDLVGAALEAGDIEAKLVDTGNPRDDVRSILRAMAEDMSGAGECTLIGFLSALRTDPDITTSFRTNCVGRVNAHLRKLFADELGHDDPVLDIRAVAGPAILMYLGTVCGQPVDADALSRSLTDLLFAPAPDSSRPRGEPA